MINYKTITDTGPYSFSGFVVNRQQNFLHGLTATETDTQPPGSPPTKCSEQSPPAFFEQGIRTRWLLLYHLLSNYLNRIASITPLRHLRRSFISLGYLDGKRRKAFNRLTAHRTNSTPTTAGSFIITSFFCSTVIAWVTPPAIILFVFSSLTNNFQ